MHRWIGGVGLVIVIGILPWLLPTYNLHIINIALVYIVLALSLNFMLGYVGELPLCQAAFFGVGAYASAKISMGLGVDVWGAVILAVIVSALVGLAVGYMALQVTGHYFVLITLAFAELIHIVVLKWVTFTGGAQGITEIPPLGIPLIGANGLAIRSTFGYYFVLVGVAVLVVYIAIRVTKSHLGMTFKAMRENDALAQAVGINRFKYKLLAFTGFALLSGLAGSVYAHYVGVISPTLLTFGYTLLPLVAVVLGGKGTVVGPIVGGLVVAALPEYLRFMGQYRLVMVGVVLIVVIVFLPEGIGGYIATRLPRSIKEVWARG